MSQEAISLMIIAIVTLSYAQLSRPKESSTMLIPSRPSQQREVDVTRWRHDGSQPVLYTREDFLGNREQFEDSTASGLQVLVS